MHRMFIVVCLCLFIFAGISSAQVLADFSSAANGTAGFSKGWGDALTGVARVDDATYGGVLELSYSSAGGNGGALQISPLDLQWTASKTGAAYFSFDVFLPADIPDDFLLKVWGQTMEGGWQWVDYKYSNSGIESGIPLVKGAWNTISFPIIRTVENYPNFKPWNSKGGLEIYFSSAWTGKVLLDNYSIWGVEPKLMADFNSAANGTQGFGKGWGDALQSVERVDDATYGGVLKLNYNTAGSQSGAAQVSPLDLGWTASKEGAGFFSYDVFIPADFPDNLILKVWAQTMEGGWQWVDYKWSNAGLEGGLPLNKGAWNTLTFPVLRTVEQYPNFKPWNSKGGIEIWFNAAWTGSLLIDNMRAHTLEVGKKWVAADFEKEAGGTQGFANTGWNLAMTAMSWAADPTSQSVGVLKTDWDFTKDTKAQSVKELSLEWTATDTGATAITLDIWVPNGFPNTPQISLWAQDKSTWTWNEISFYVNDSTFKHEQWTTLSFDVLAKAAAGTFDPKAPVNFGFQIYAPAETWAGSVYWDNLTLVGIEAPTAPLKSPVAAFDVTSATVNHITWTDNEANYNETYSVYMSESAFSNINDAGVVQIASKVPRGVQYWNHVPYTTKGAEKTFYYCVTVTGPDGVELDPDQGGFVGPVTNTTQVTIKAIYDPNFKNIFVADGDPTEFFAYNPIYEIGAVSDSGQTDLAFRAMFAVDDDYLYLGAYVYDDDPYGGDGAGQGWWMDALELYIGFYDIHDLVKWHTKGDIHTTPSLGDERISFCADGRTQYSGSQNFDYPGLDYVTDRGFVFDEGYTIEARFDLDSLTNASYSGFTPVLGDMMPFRIDVNDNDPNKGDADGSRTLQINFGGSANDENWLRPSSWGYMEVFDTTSVGIADEKPNLPIKTALIGNYPNPFNPETMIRFDLAKKSAVTLKVYNVLGQVVQTLANYDMEAGAHQIKWNGLNKAGDKVVSGIYFYELKTKEYQKTRKMILIR